MVLKKTLFDNGCYISHTMLKYFYVYVEICFFVYKFFYNKCSRSSNDSLNIKALNFELACQRLLYLRATPLETLTRSLSEF